MSPDLSNGFPCLQQDCRLLIPSGRGDVVAYNVPIECGGVMVNPGDIMFGDADGVVVSRKQLKKM